MSNKIANIWGDSKVLMEQNEKTRENISKKETNMENQVKKRYDAVSKNGDTLELSEKKNVTDCVIKK